MICIVLVGAMVAMFGLSAAAGIGILIKSFDTYSSSQEVSDSIQILMVPLLAGFIGGAALVWFYNTVAACRPS